MAISCDSEGLSGSKLYGERELWKEPATGLQLWVCSVETEQIFYPTLIEQPALWKPLTEVTYHFSTFSGFLKKSAQQLCIPALGLPPVKAANLPEFPFSYLWIPCAHTAFQLWGAQQGQSMSSTCLAEGVLLESSSSQCLGSMHLSPKRVEDVQCFCHPWRQCRQMVSHKVDEGCSLAWDCAKARDEALWSSAPEIQEFTFYCCIIWVRAWKVHCQTPPLAC